MMKKDKEKYVELGYVVHPFPDQKKYIFRIYNAEELEVLYQNNNLKHSLTIEHNNILLNVGHEHFVLKNVNDELIEQFLSKKIVWGFSFLDCYHAVLSGFYADHPDKYKK